jgi:hypothetical protein
VVFGNPKTTNGGLALEPSLTSLRHGHRSAWQPLRAASGNEPGDLVIADARAGVFFDEPETLVRSRFGIGDTDSILRTP